MSGDKKIKLGESVAIEYFQSRGYSNIIHEPDGNVPPDLLIDNNIAVEVRRLNQFKNIGGVDYPLENLEYALMPRVRKIVNSFDPSVRHATALVSVDFRRPLKVDKSLFNDIENLLRANIDSIGEKTQYQIRDNLRIRFWPSKKNYNRPYVWASSSDGDGGGFVVGNILRSLNIIIKEKEEKILPFKANYQVWWLAVHDKVGLGIDEMDLDQLTVAFNIKTFFERIIFISPFASSEGRELTVPGDARI